MTIKDLKEFIQRHELTDSTEIELSKGAEILTADSFGVITKCNGKPIEHKLLISNDSEY